MTDQYWLSAGSHKTAADGRCAMEWVAYLAGEPHSASPRCVCPTLRAFCIGLNDALPDGERQRLRPYLARTIGTRGDGLAVRREWMALDWLTKNISASDSSLWSAWIADRIALGPEGAAAVASRAAPRMGLCQAAFELLDRMLPTEAIRLPMAEDAALVCGVR